MTEQYQQQALQYTNQQLQVFMHELKPAILLDSAENAQLIHRYLDRNNLLPTVGSLHRAVAALQDVLTWTVRPNPRLVSPDAVAATPATPEPPKELTHADLMEQARKFAEREAKRIQQEKLENSEADFWKRKKAAEAKEAAEKEALVQEVCKRDTEAMIAEFVCDRHNGPGVDWGRTEHMRGDMRGIAVRVNGKTDWKQTKAAINKLRFKVESTTTLEQWHQILADHGVR